MTTTPEVTVGGMLRSRPDALGLAIDVLAGAAGFDRLITSPYIQKTGLALWTRLIRDAGGRSNYNARCCGRCSRTMC